MCSLSHEHAWRNPPISPSCVDAPPRAESNPVTTPLIVIAAGGTAGQVVPALAVAAALRARGAIVVFVGGDQAEQSLVPAAGYELRVLPRPRRRAGGLARAAAADGEVFLASRRLLRALAPQAVLGAGGYVVGPVVLAARLQRIPLVLLESDRRLSLTNRLHAPSARRVCLAFPIAGRTGPRYRLTGRPVPLAAVDRAGARARFGITPHEDCVVVFGGSEGAQSINRAALEAFSSARFRVLHAAGDRHLPQLHAPGPHYDLRGYIPDFSEALAAGDLVVGRSGASVWEVAAAGRPMVLVPSPHATADYQAENARYVESMGAAVVIPDRELTAQRLASEVGALLADRKRLQAMAKASSSLARRNAAADVAEELLVAAG